MSEHLSPLFPFLFLSTLLASFFFYKDVAVSLPSEEDCSQSCHPPYQSDIARMSDSAVKKDNKVLSLLQLRYRECQIQFTLMFDFLKLFYGRWRIMFCGHTNFGFAEFKGV